MNNLNMTEGRPLPVIFRFMGPLLLGTICQQLYTVADSAVVGRFVGATALGSVGMVSGVCNLLLALCVGLSGGANIYASQCFGAGRAETLRAVVRNSIFVTVIVGAAMSLIGICLTKPVLHAMGTPAMNMRYAQVYMRIVCGGMLVTAFYNTFSQLLRAVGDSATPLYAVMASSVTNVVLDLLLVAVFHTGVAGAAAATVASQILSVAWLYVRGLRRHESLMPLRAGGADPDVSSSKMPKVPGSHKNSINKIHRGFTICLSEPDTTSPKIHRPDNRRIIKMICLLGIPLAIQNAMGSITGVIIQRAVNSFGSEMMSAYTVAGRVNELFLLPLSSLGVAIANFAGQNTGAGRFDRIAEGVRKCFLVEMLYSFVCLMVILLFGRNLAGIFVKDTDVIQTAVPGLIVYGLCIFISSLVFLYKATLNGAGDAVFTMWNGLAEVAGSILFLMLFLHVFHLGENSIWFSHIPTVIVAALMAYLRYRSGGWKKGLEA